ncbi:hypothetical protein [Ilumatobacter sp.]|uniref:hypothetical protein n=1 Tax=Ilumatobacter sp. TaxID=1967498 RepID=UPI003C55C159
MNTSPSIDQILEGVLLAIEDEILPALNNPKAFATAQMMQSLLQGVRQTLPVMDAQLVDEHNDMIRTLVDTAAALGDATGDAADRVRGRASAFGAWDPLPAPVDRDAVIAAHTELGRAIETTFLDLDELQRAGISSADDAVQVVRAHLGPRYVRDVQTICVGEGFIGRS